MNAERPAILEGTPVRVPGMFRRTPEVNGVEEEVCKGFVETLGVPNQVSGVLRRGLPPNIRFDTGLARAIGAEPAAAAAEFAELQAPGEKVWAVPVTNGTHAITATLAALSAMGRTLSLREPQVGDEVIVPALTFAATAEAVLRRNLVPVIVDVDPDTLCIDPAAVAAAITRRTVAVLPVHPYQRMADVDALRTIAQPRGIAIGEDAAHAHGARLVERRERSTCERFAGTLGDFGTFSFQDSKTLTCWDGGMVLTRHESLFEQLVATVNVGRRFRRSEPMLSGNYRMPKPAAAFLRAQMRRFPEQSATRTHTFAEMARVGPSLPGISVLAPQPHVVVPPGYKFLLRVDLEQYAGMSLDQVARALSAELLCEVARIYEPLTRAVLYAPHRDTSLRINADFWRRIDPAIYSAPVAEQAYETTLALPHSVGLDETFPDALEVAVRKIHAYAPKLARRLRRDGRR